MSSEYHWVVVGRASRLPVASFDRKHKLVTWLKRRTGHGMLSVFRLNPLYTGRGVTFNRVYIDIEELLREDNNQ